MYISNDIAERIKKIAKNKKISVKHLLEEVGLGFNTMSNMKTSMPKADSLAKIADYLNVSVDYLLGRTDIPSPLQTENSDTSTSEFSALFSKLSKEQQKMLIAQIKGLLNDKSI